jgi:O-antigen/teichoic acid export membrane protein
MAYVVYVGRTVGPAEYADFAAALSVIYFVGVALSPLTPAIGRLTARYAGRGDHGAVAGLRRQLNLRLAAGGAVVLVAGIVAAPALARLLQFRAAISLIAAMVAVLVYALLSVDRAVAQGLLRFPLYNANTLIESVVRAIVAVALLRIHPTAISGLAAYVVALVVAELAMVWSLAGGSTRGAAAPVDWTDVRRLTLPIVVLMLAVACFQNADMLIVKHFFDASSAGTYGAATALARGIGVIFVPLYVLAGPLLTRMHEANEPIFGATLKLGATFLALVVVPLALFSVAPRLIVTILYGERYAAAGQLLAPLAGVAAVTYTGLMLSQALLTVGHARFLYVYAFATVAQIVALLLFHDGFHEVLAALWAVQLCVLAVITLLFAAAARAQPTPC